MKRVLVFFEGKDDLREGFSKLLRKALPKHEGRIRTVAGGDRDRTKKKYMQARKLHPDHKVILLVDSDEPRQGLPSEPSEQYMVQVMESWFLADRFGVTGFLRRWVPGIGTSWESPDRGDCEEGRTGLTAPGVAAHGKRRLPQGPTRSGLTGKDRSGEVEAGFPTWGPFVPHTANLARRVTAERLTGRTSWD